MTKWRWSIFAFQVLLTIFTIWMAHYSSQYAARTQAQLKEMQRRLILMKEACEHPGSAKPIIWRTH